MNRNFLRNILLLTLAAFFTFSCKKEEEEPTQESQEETQEEGRIAERWEVKTSDARRSQSKGFIAPTNGQGGLRVAEGGNAGGYQSFEFNLSGTFIIVAGGEVISGNYSLEDQGKTIVLINHGTITINSRSENSINFTLELNGDSSEISAQAVPAIEELQGVDYFFQTWEVVSIEPEFLYAGSEYKIVFSEYGTYLVETTTSGIKQYANNSWKWKDGEHDHICYSQFDGTLPTCEQYADILKLEKDTFKLDDNGIVFTMVPADDFIVSQ
ncbi:hypothetical protein RCC89_04085 [Cytophagaceae bacterium ABcell3]|nr:hypothetical protein RCC89_04085 [Cytophagaceae bacterium ABcell3]